MLLGTRLLLHCQKLRLVEAELGEMHSACQDMDRKLENATKRTSHLIRQTSSLKAQRLGAAAYTTPGKC